MKTKFIFSGIVALALLAVVTIKPVGVKASAYSDCTDLISGTDFSSCRGLEGDPSITTDPLPDPAYQTCIDAGYYADQCNGGQNPANTPGSSGDQGSGSTPVAPAQSTPSTFNPSNIDPYGVNVGTVQQNKNGTTYGSGVAPISNSGVSSTKGLAPYATAIVQTGTFTIKNPLQANSVSELVQTASQIFAYVVVLIGVMALIWTGLLYVLAQGNSEKLTQLKKQLLWIVVGIAIVIGARIIINIVVTTLSKSGAVNQSIINNAYNGLEVK
ncbi:MAG: pilin [Candidatus Taylorbacteria bacterium]